MTKKDETPDEKRPQILAAVMDHVPFDGWSQAAIKAAAKDVGLSREYIELAFPAGVDDMVKAYLRGIDDEMMAELEKLNVDEMRIRDRISTAIKTRMAINARHREVVRRTLAHLSLPSRAPLSMKSLWRTADLIWRWAGDTATDYNHYTKRVILSGVYSSTLLYWLNDESEDSKDTWAFLDRRIENIMQFEKLKAKGIEVFDKLPNIFTILAEAKRGKSKPQDPTESA